MAEHGFTDGKDIYNLTSILQRLSNLESRIKESYPVGSIYMSVKNTNPSTFFGGTWVAWGQGRVPVGMGGSYTSVEGTGGADSKSVKPTGGISGSSLNVRQLPAHQHRIWGVNRNINVQGGGSDANYNALYTSDMHDVPGDVLVGWSENGYAGIKPDGSVSEDNQCVGEPHYHNLTLNNVNVDVRQAYITCYMWKRTA